MVLQSHIWFGLAVGCIALGTGLFVYTLAVVASLERPILGSRGLQRSHALSEKDNSFKAIEPIVLKMGGWISCFELGNIRQTIEKKLYISGYYLGLLPDEFLAMSLLSALGMGGLSTVMVMMTNLPSSLVFAALLTGGFLPWSQLQTHAARRSKIVTRRLPSAVDLISLCMGAGLDFPGALRQVTAKSALKDDPLIFELRWILQELDLGRTREQALEGFAERVPSDPVREFVGAVIQAEKKGNPLAPVLRIQAGVQRLHRTQRAEEAAVRAGLLMMVPMVMVFMVVLIVLAGPFVVSLSQGN